MHDICFSWCLICKPYACLHYIFILIKNWRSSLYNIQTLILLMEHSPLSSLVLSLKFARQKGMFMQLSLMTKLLWKLDLVILNHLVDLKDGPQLWREGTIRFGRHHNIIVCILSVCSFGKSPPPCICFLGGKYKDRRVDDGMASHNWSELKCATVAERIYAALKQIL